jgi:hypothetical protein
VFLRINRAIFINWLPPGEKFNSGYSGKKYSSRLLRSCILSVPHLIDQLQRKSVLKVANSDMLPNLGAALISVHATSFCWVICKRSSKAKSPRRWKRCKGKLRSHLVSPLRTKCDEYMDTESSNLYPWGLRLKAIVVILVLVVRSEGFMVRINCFRTPYKVAHTI